MMQQVATQNTDIAAFGTSKVPVVKVKDNASDEFSKVFNDENWGRAKPVSPVSKTEGESHYISQTDKVVQGDSQRQTSTDKSPEQQSAANEVAAQNQSAEQSTQASSAPLEADTVSQDKVSAPAPAETPLTEALESDSAFQSLEQQSHNQLMDFIAKLQSQQWGQTQTAETAESLPLFESTEEQVEVIPQSLLNTLLAKLTHAGHGGGAEQSGSDEAPVAEKLDDELLTQLLALLGGEQSDHSADQSGIEVDAALLSDKPEVSKADLQLLSILLLPASPEKADSELAMAEEVIPEQLQLDMLTDISKTGSDKQEQIMPPTVKTSGLEVPESLKAIPIQARVEQEKTSGFEVSESLKAIPIQARVEQEKTAELEVPESLKAIPVQAQVEQEVIAPLNKLVDDQALKSLLKVPENKLEAVLTNLAQRVVDEQVVVDQVKGLSVAVGEPDKQLFVADFVTALKAGVDEFKQQLKQGREPGIDLKAMVAEALAKVSEVSADGLKDPLKLEQLSKSFAQVMELGQNIHSALEQHVSATNVYDRQVRGESNQLHIETAKLQLTQHSQVSQFDKAVNINKPEGHQQLAEKVQWMVNQKNMLAEIRLDPAELGSMSVKVNIQGDAASVSFVVQTQHARDALEQAVPRLREMLAEKGIALGQSSVQQEDKNKQDGEGKQTAGRFSEHEEDLPLDEQSSGISQRISNGALGGIDYFV